MEEFTSFYFEERGTGNLCAILVGDSIPRREVAFQKSCLEDRLRRLCAGGWPHELTAAAVAAWPDESRRIVDGIKIVGPTS